MRPAIFSEPPGATFWRTRDAAAVNALANDPLMRPCLGGNPADPLDLANAVADEANLFLAGTHGVLIYAWSAPRTYELHAMIRPAGRGGWARRFIAETLEHVALYCAASLIWCRAAPDRRDVRWLACSLGFRADGQITADIGSGPVTFTTFSRRA